MGLISLQSYGWYFDMWTCKDSVSLCYFALGSATQKGPAGDVCDFSLQQIEGKDGPRAFTEIRDAWICELGHAFESTAKHISANLGIVLRSLGCTLICLGMGLPQPSHRLSWRTLLGNRYFQTIGWHEFFCLANTPRWPHCICLVLSVYWWV